MVSEASLRRTREADAKCRRNLRSDQARLAPCRPRAAGSAKSLPQVPNFYALRSNYREILGSCLLVPFAVGKYFVHGRIVTFACDNPERSQTGTCAYFAGVAKESRSLQKRRRPH